MLKRIIAAVIALSCVACAQKTDVEPETVERTIAENPEPWLTWSLAQPDWVKPADPFTIIDNVHYVGTKGLGSYLITSDDGHILIDGAMPQSASNIIDNIKTLGFDIADVKILLNSHAHFDHSGGLAELTEKSGAELIAHEGDVSALEGGFYLGFEDKANLSAPPVKVDGQVQDGDTVQLGDTVLTANLTPGHTRGCTTWSMTAHQDNNPYEIVFFCSASVAANTLVPEQYEGIVADYRTTFEKTRSWRPDIPLAFHDQFFDFWSQREAQLAGDPLAYVDRDSFQKFLRGQEEKFEKELARQISASTPE